MTASASSQISHISDVTKDVKEIVDENDFLLVVLLFPQ